MAPNREDGTCAAAVSASGQRGGATRRRHRHRSGRLGPGQRRAQQLGATQRHCRETSPPCAQAQPNLAAAGDAEQGQAGHRLLPRYS
eukprot:6172213-Pleurochrysis_carterae.AAC.2